MLSFVAAVGLAWSWSGRNFTVAFFRPRQAIGELVAVILAPILYTLVSLQGIRCLSEPLVSQTLREDELDL